MDIDSVLNNQRIKGKIKGETKSMETKMETQNTKTYGMQQSSLKGKFTAIHAQKQNNYASRNSERGKQTEPSQQKKVNKDYSRYKGNREQENRKD